MKKNKGGWIQTINDIHYKSDDSKHKTCECKVLQAN